MDNTLFVCYLMSLGPLVAMEQKTGISGSQHES